MLKYFKGIDMYGESVHINYQGHEKYKTIYGALVTLVVIFIMTFYSAFKLKKLILMENPDQLKNTIW